MMIPSKVTCVISGGQTGVDQAALRAAAACKLKTGGYMPKGYRTLAGPHPAFAAQYGLLELSSSSYKVRTVENVKMADATIRFARHWTSPGEICTRHAVDDHAKPMLDVDERAPWPIQDVVNWLFFHGVKILNVAGNSERTAPGIGAAAEAYFRKVFTACAADWSEARPLRTRR